MRALACSAASRAVSSVAFGRLRRPEVAQPPRNSGAATPAETKRARVTASASVWPRRSRPESSSPPRAGGSSRRTPLEARRRFALALRREQDEEAFARHFLGVVAEQRLGAAAHGEDAARLVERDDAVGGRIEQRREIARLAFDDCAARSWYSTSRERRSASSVAGAPSHSIGFGQRVDGDQLAAGRDQRHGAAFARFGEGLRVAAAEHARQSVGGAKLGEVAIAGEIQHRRLR